MQTIFRWQIFRTMFELTTRHAFISYSISHSYHMLLYPRKSIVDFLQQQKTILWLCTGRGKQWKGENGPKKGTWKKWWYSSSVKKTISHYSSILGLRTRLRYGAALPFEIDGKFYCVRVHVVVVKLSIHSERGVHDDIEQMIRGKKRARGRGRGESSSHAIT